MRSIREPSGSTEVQLAGSMNDHTVPDHDARDVGVVGEFGHDASGEFDRNRPLGDGSRVIWCVGVDDCNELWPAGATRCDFAGNETSDRVGGEELVLLDRIAWTELGDGFGKQRGDTCVDGGGHFRSEFGIEPAAEVPHAVAIGPGCESCRFLLSSQTVLAVVPPEPLHLELESLSEFIGGRRCCDVGQSVHPVQEFVALVGFEPLLRPCDCVDVASGDVADLQRIGQGRRVRHRVGAFSGCAGLAE